jgi:hypothetical protein
MTKQYSSFTEIDQDLRILQLERNIAKESLKLNLKITKNHISPAKVIDSASFNVKQFVIDFALNKALYWLKHLRNKR